LRNDIMMFFYQMEPQFRLQMHQRTFLLQSVSSKLLMGSLLFNFLYLLRVILIFLSLNTPHNDFLIGRKAP